MGNEKGDGEWEGQRGLGREGGEGEGGRGFSGGGKGVVKLQKMHSMRALFICFSPKETPRWCEISTALRPLRSELSFSGGAT